jgi:hypothetical protein
MLGLLAISAAERFPKATIINRAILLRLCFISIPSF